MAQGEATQGSGVRVGCLALQGSFREHMALLKKIGVDVIEVRTKEELESVAGLIIPGGESTTMALVAERWGLIPELQAFAKSGKPIWGTCAGMIFLAERAEGGWGWGQLVAVAGAWVLGLQSAAQQRTRLASRCAHLLPSAS